jgi:pilus assembly protein CpaB
MNRNTRTLLVVLIAIATAGVATFAAYRAIQSIPVREIEVAQVQLVAATRELPVGSLVTKDDLKLVPWPSASQIPGSFTSTDQVVNRGVIVGLAENEPLTESKLAPVGSGGGLPPTIPEGMRAISLKVNEVIGVAGFVIPGTRVDVLVALRKEPDALARVVVSNVTVLTAGTRFDQEASRRDGKPIPTSVVTLVVTPDDAEKLTLAAEQGKVMLTLRNPLDTEPTKTDGANLANLFEGPNPPPVQKTVQGRRVVRAAPPPPPAPAPPKAYTVETIRAAKRSDEEVR